MKKILDIINDLPPGSRYLFNPDSIPAGHRNALPIPLHEIGNEQVPNVGYERDNQKEQPPVDSLDSGAGATDALPIFEIPPEIDEARLVAALGGTEGQRISAAIKVRGVDALAWYVPFHATGLQWGIYIPLSSIARLALLDFEPLKCDLNAKMNLAFQLLHQHELFHFATEYATAQAEILIGKPIYRHGKPKTGNLSYIALEEQLANAWSYRTLTSRVRRIWNVPGKAAIITKIFKAGPKGYRDFQASLEYKTFFDDDCEDLVRLIYGEEGAGLTIKGATDIRQLFPLETPGLWRHCPLFIFHDEREYGLPELGISLFPKILTVTESDKFQHRLNKLGANVQNLWDRTKIKLLKDPSLPGLDLKRWKELYSIRLNDNFRAHLSYQPDLMFAIEIGSHKDLGHG